MASPNILTVKSPGVLLRVAAPEFDELTQIIFRRYPRYEWATFARFGWRETADNLIITLAGLDCPEPGDMDEQVGHVKIHDPYSLRIALAAERHTLCVGIVHSHPKEGAPRPSPIDDDMDTYYACYFEGFAPGRPYVSLILSMKQSVLALSGRIHWRHKWLYVHHTVAERPTIVETWPNGYRPPPAPNPPERVARFTSTFGIEAYQRLRRSTVAVIGAGGTGSAAIPILARAGLGRIIIVDPDRLSESNLERTHGSTPPDVDDGIPKATLAAREVLKIDRSIDVESFIGKLPQQAIIDAVVSADVILGCTDQHHSRLAISDIAIRYLVPAIDTAALLEGGDGQMTGQIAQFVRFFAADPCALCREMINPVRVTQELMSPEDRERRRAAAREAKARGEEPNPYWQEIPQINTVGYLTTAIGAMAAGYVIGWLTRRFDAPFQRLQMNLVAEYLDVTDQKQGRRPHCSCGRMRGWADQGSADALITAPAHWSAIRRVTP